MKLSVLHVYLTVCIVSVLPLGGENGLDGGHKLSLQVTQEKKPSHYNAQTLFDYNYMIVSKINRVLVLVWMRADKTSRHH